MALNTTGIMIAPVHIKSNLDRIKSQALGYVGQNFMQFCRKLQPGTRLNLSVQRIEKTYHYGNLECLDEYELKEVLSEVRKGGKPCLNNPLIDTIHLTIPGIEDTMEA